MGEKTAKTGATSNSFVSFFETLKKSEASQRGQQRQPTDLLRYLANPATVSEVVSASGIPIDEIASALKTLQAAGLIKAQGFTAADLIELTDIGAKLAAPLSMPAAIGSAG